MEKENNQIKITTPVAIIIAGFLVMVGIVLTGGFNIGKNINNKGNEPKTLSQQLGVSKEKLMECIQDFDSGAFFAKVDASVEGALKSIPQESRGTPYSVIVNMDSGTKIEIQGAAEPEAFIKAIGEVTSGNIVKPYVGEIVVNEEGDHIYGNPKAPVRIIEYSDYGCSYCRKLHSTLEKIVNESNGSVSWVYRHLPISQESIAKIITGECVSQIKGNDAFWKYSKLVFDMQVGVKTNTFESSL